MDKPKICKDCGGKMSLVVMPNSIFTIPFTGGRFSIFDWENKEFQCIQCITDRENEKRRDNEEYQRGRDDGAQDAFKIISRKSEKEEK